MRLVIAAIAAALFLNGCGLTSWFRGDGELEPMAELVDFEPTIKVKRVWSADIGAKVGKKYLVLSPYLDGNTVYATDSEGQVSAYDANSGDRLWRVELDQAISSGVGGNGALIFLGTRKGQMLALQKDQGKQAWSATLSSEILAAPVAAGGVVVAQTADGKVFGLSTTDGKVLWEQERTVPSLTLRGTSMPVIAGNIVVTGFASGKLAAFNLKDGRPLWEVTIAEPRGRNEIERLVDVDARPLINGKTVFAAGYQGRIIAVQLETGNPIWGRELSTYTGMGKDMRNVYVSDHRSHLVAFDAATGAVAWRQEKLRGRGTNMPAITNDHVVVGDGEGYLHVLRKEDGDFVGRYRLGSSAIRAQAIVAGDTVYVLSQDGKLAALKIQ